VWSAGSVSTAQISWGGGCPACTTRSLRDQSIVSCNTPRNG
jgi:hypothetical protein